MSFVSERAEEGAEEPPAAAALAEALAGAAGGCARLASVRVDAWVLLLRGVETGDSAGSKSRCSEGTDSGRQGS